MKLIVEGLYFVLYFSVETDGLLTAADNDTDNWPVPWQLREKFDEVKKICKLMRLPVFQNGQLVHSSHVTAALTGSLAKVRF